MRAVKEIICAVLLSTTLVFSGGASAHAQDWQDKKSPEKPREKDKPDRDERRNDDKKQDDKKDEGKKKPF